MGSSLRKNYLYNVLYQILNVITPLFTAPYLARVLGPGKIGVYSYSYSIAYYFMMFSMLGINTYGNRTCAMIRSDKERLSKTFSEIYCLQALLTVVCLAFYFIRLPFVSNETQVITIIMTMFILSAGFDINWFFFGLEEFKLTTRRNIIIKVISTICIFIFIRSSNDLPIYTFIMAGGNLLTQLVMWPYLRRYIKFSFPKAIEVGKHLRPNLVLFLPVIAVSLYKMMDKVMLGNISTMNEVGYYENAEKLINIPLGFINALGVIMLPRMSNLSSQKEKKQSELLLDNSFLFVSFLSVALTFGMMSIADEFVPLFFGENFAPAIRLVKWIAPTMIFFSYANVIRTQYLLPNKQDKAYIISVFIGAGVNLIFNGLMIPQYGAFGAVLGTLLAEANVCLTQMYFVRKQLSLVKYVKWGFVFVLFGLVMMWSVRKASSMFENLWGSVVFEVFIGGIVYVCLSVVYLWKTNPSIIKLIGLERVVHGLKRICKSR